MFRLAFLVAAALAAATAFAQQPAAGDERFRQLMEQARARSGAAATVPTPLSAERLRERLALLGKAEAALAAVEVEAALAAFDQASSILHAADTELGLTRAYMQGGEYRRALAFVAHTAGAHREAPGGPALYAWLLHLGGQRAAAKRLLDETEARLPESRLIKATSRELAAPLPLAQNVLLETPARLAPYGTAVPLPAGARVAGSGVLVDGGRRALVPAATLKGAKTVWLRNGIGATSRATVERRLPGVEVAVLRLELPLGTGAPLAPAPRDPFPGSPGITVEFTPSPAATPGWPLLTVGFVGMPIASTPYRQLGIELPKGPRGGPVFDAAGRLAGMALPGGSGGDRLVPVSLLHPVLGEVQASAAAPATGPTIPVDQVYEKALQTVVQVIAS